MSTDYRSTQKIRFDELFDGRLSKYGIHEYLESQDTTEQCRCLTNAYDYLWCYGDELGILRSMTRRAFKTSKGIVTAISEIFDTEILCEHDPRYWGFATEEEWDAAWEEQGKKDRDEFYGELLKHLRGSPKHIERGTNGIAHGSNRGGTCHGAAGTHVALQ